MDELIKRHLEERDAQLKQYAPKPPVPVPGPVPASTLTETIPGNIPIAAQAPTQVQTRPPSGQAAPNITLEPVQETVQETVEESAQESARELEQKKENLVETKILALSNKVTMLVDELQLIHKKIDILLNYNAIIYKDLSQNTPLVWTDISGQDYELGC
jgi:hypothetical protein